MLRAERLTPAMVRLVLGGPDLVGLDVGASSDRYVKLLFPERAVDGRPPVRAYTVRSWDAAASQMTIDVVVHGTGDDAGIAAAWAASARPGDTVRFRGPGGGYAPRPEAPWHLLLGDESALPAIAAAAEAVPRGVPVLAVVEVASPAEEQPLASPGRLDVRWVHRGPGTPAGQSLVAAAGALDLVALQAEHGGAPQVFLHGEAGAVRSVRRTLRAAGLAAGDLSASGYWRLGRSDEAWRTEKRGWNEAVAADDAELAGPA